MDKQAMRTLNRIKSYNEPEQEAMICSACGSYMEEADMYNWFCPECGNFFSEETYMDENDDMRRDD